MKTSWTILCIVCLGFACTSKNFKEPEMDGGTSGPMGRVFSRSFTDVWNATLSALSDKKYVIAESKRDSGILITDWMMGKSDRLFSGYGDTRIPYGVRFKLTVKLAPSKEGVKIVVKNDEQYLSDSITAGVDFGGSLYQWIPTRSSGTKEGSLLAEVANRLNLQQEKR